MKEMLQHSPIMPMDKQPESKKFFQECERLLAVLGELTEGGVVEGIQPIGATSVPGMPGGPCIDIGLAIWPFPLDAEQQKALTSLDYHVSTGYEGAPEQRFVKAAGTFQLVVVEAGSERWTDMLLLRDYLRHDPEARQAFVARKLALAASTGTLLIEKGSARTQLFRETTVAARQWCVTHRGFGPVEAVTKELEALSCPWHISSGWAIDLFLGQVTRVHHDLDVSIARNDQLTVQEYMTERGWKWVTPYEDQLKPWPPHMRLELPRHQAHAHRAGAMLDFLFSDSEHGVWRFRRNPIVVRSLDRLSLRTESGISYLAPEIVLLFKSKPAGDKARAKDQQDFAKVCNHLEPERRAWLRWALIATTPDHPWIELLKG